MVDWIRRRFATKASSVIINTSIRVNSPVGIMVPWGSTLHIEGCLVIGQLEVHTQNKDGTWNPPLKYGVV